MRYLLTIYILSIVFHATGQDLKTLERDIQQTDIANLKEIRNKANNIYRLDLYNEVATDYLIKAYRNANSDDSIAIFFSKLKNMNPGNPIPYLLSAKFQFHDLSILDTSRLAELQIALQLDSTSYEAHYLLGAAYYTLFHLQHTNYYASQSRFYLVKASQLNKSSLLILKYPIIQTSTFLRDNISISAYDSMEMPSSPGSVTGVPNGGYFPLTPFLDIKDNWRSDYSFDIIREVDLTIRGIDWYWGHLRALKEPILFNQRGKAIYRFTWLRTFHHPVAIRIEKDNNKYTLYWKESGGSGGFNHGKLTLSRSKHLTKRHWDNFIALLLSTDYWNMPTQSKEIIGSDGSVWIIEGIENERYHIVARWTPEDNNYQRCGQFLIHLTGLKIAEDDFY